MKRLLCFVICLSMSLSVCLSVQAEGADIVADPADGLSRGAGNAVSAASLSCIICR